ncbi:MAG: NADH-quinone oxidoreductase subunit K [Coriobacteriia bacterium]|nr:NADH-quinone oxidoreductase subunit K [Coriobacteriia bacterium]
MTFVIFIIAVVLSAACGIYTIIATRNLIRMLIALEILNKSATLLLVLAGSLNGQMARAESFIIALIIVEVVLTAVGAIIVIATHARTGSIIMRKTADRGEAASDE